MAVVREFLEFFQLDFTTAVFDPETNAVSQQTCMEGGRGRGNCETENTLLLVLVLLIHGEPRETSCVC